jgi:hypothetical protein
LIFSHGGPRLDLDARFTLPVVSKCKVKEAAFVLPLDGAYRIEPKFLGKVPFTQKNMEHHLMGSLVVAGVSKQEVEGHAA